MFEMLLSFGLLGVFILTFAERVVPVIPSYVLFALIGVMAAEQEAFLNYLLVAMMGSVFGGLLLYGIGRLVPTYKITSIAVSVGRVVGAKAETTHKWLNRIEDNSVPLVGFTQMVPTIRLLSPLFAGFFRAPVIKIAATLVVGTFCWVFLFVSAAWIATLYMPEQDPLIVTLWVTVGLLTFEFLALSIWYGARRMLKNFSSSSIFISSQERIIR